MQQIKYYLIPIYFLITISSSAQPAATVDQDITGLWKGTLYNDTTQKYYRYEIGISEEKGKLSGFSHTWFILDDKQYYGVKKLKIKKASDGKIIIEDAGLIANNYPETPAKGVRQLNVLTLHLDGPVMTLTGPFTTNQTRQFSALTGTVSLERKNDFWQSALVPHLQELGLSNDLSFVKKDNDDRRSSELQLAKVPAHEIVSPKALKKDESKQTASENKQANSRTQTAEELSPKEIADTKHERKAAVAGKPSDIKQAPEVSVTSIPFEKTAPQLPAADVMKRTTIVQQTVYYNSDSLLLTLYDNGEVDGDTVTVLMNGKIIMAKEGLSTNAVRKTIDAQNTDSIELIMYAENLGAIAPNTGLLVVRDNNNIYEIRFSGDLQKNSSIIFKRRKNNNK